MTAIRNDEEGGRHGMGFLPAILCLILACSTSLYGGVPDIDLPPPMYPHPELGCGRDWRFGGYFRCGWKIAKRAVWSDVIVLVAPPLSQHFGFL